MKIFTRALTGALFALALFAGLASAAQYMAVHADNTDLRFRTHAAATVGNEYANYGVDFLGGFADSGSVSRVGAQSAVLCTTLAVPTKGWLSVQNQAISDTSGAYCVVAFYDAGGTGCESGADSLYIAAQGSYDGRTWVSLATFKTGASASITSRLSQANVDGNFYGALTLNGAARANGAPVWNVLYKQRAVSALDGIDIGGSIQRFPLLRWIVGMPDAKGYKIAGKVQYFTAEEN